MRRWDVDRNIATQIKIPKIKKTHEIFEDLIGLKIQEGVGWQNLREKDSAHMNGYHKDKYKSRWLIQKSWLDEKELTVDRSWGKALWSLGRWGRGSLSLSSLLKVKQGEGVRGLNGGMPNIYSSKYKTNTNKN